MTTYRPLAICDAWACFNDGLIRLVDYVPDDRLDWSPKTGLWTFREILVHIAIGRDTWLSRNIKDGLEPPPGAPHTRDECRAAYQRTWERLGPFLCDGARLDATYDTRHGPRAGHWIAFHLLEHDIHHGADIFHYLALLGIETPDVGTP